MNSLMMQADPVLTPGATQPPRDRSNAIPGRPPSWLARMVRRCRESVWAPVLLRVSGVTTLMLGLATVGASSILTGSSGVAVPPSASAAVEQGWLAPTPGSPPVPAIGSSSPAPAASLHADDGDPPRGAPGVTADGKVILNTASAEELRRLPGVGEKRAAAIVQLRTRLGRFRRATDLLRVRGIGVKTLRRMLPHLVLDPPQPAAPGNNP